MIKVKNALVNSPNYIGYNKTVSPATVVKSRLAGCFVPDGYQSDFITHGNSVDVFRISEHAGATDCSRFQYTCRDGALSASREASCRVTKASFDCKRDGSNNGCQKTVSCPSSKRIVGAIAACNLEYGTVSSGDLAKVPVHTIKVVKTSDNAAQGLCAIGHNGLRENNSLHTGQRMITGINGQQRVTVSCKEHDKNGGDCHIKGTLYCSND